jgi:hypothetical protein
MTRKVYRTAQGKMVDLGSLQLRNENVRSVGNMKVNARGDLIDSNNRPINTRNQQVDRQYRRQTTNVSNTPVQQGRTAAPAANIPTPPEDFQDDFVKPAEAAAPAASGGLAAAIARARQVRQEPLKTPREIAQHQEGVKKL